MTFLERLYLAGYSIKKRHKFQNRKILPRKVISVGNITLGGTGKTPAVIAVAQKARLRGFTPCILTRGYRGTASGPCFVSRGGSPVLNERQAGDEAYLMATKLQGVPVIKGKDRYEAGIFALNESPEASRPDLFILDDGFQHWGLFRDKDVLLIDCMNPFGNRRLLPLGLLREPLSEIDRAGIIIITKEEGLPASAKDSLMREIREYNKQAPVFFSAHKPLQFVSRGGDAFPLKWGEGKRFFGFCGIGNPESFRRTLLSTGMTLTGFKSFRDHHFYSQRDLQTVIGEAGVHSEWIVTTEKDIMRLRGFDLPENLVSLAIEFQVDENCYETIFAGLRT
ncbi:MAG TPA: tetraacyldisaccharide 4'-kinase [Thermodesulfovibrionales bacterium]|nr:tetraacyldisaccharide 4'-kinase [Thermodesulfovibrionales bacterium]